MFDTNKEKGDREYKEGYYTGRDADPATRAMESFLGFTNSDTTYGKGVKAGREDRYKYGSRNDSPKEEEGNKSRQPNTATNNSYSGSYNNYSGSYIDTSTGDSSKVFGIATLISAAYIIYCLLVLYHFFYVSPVYPRGEGAGQVLFNLFLIITTIPVLFVLFMIGLILSSFFGIDLF